MAGERDVLADALQHLTAIRTAAAAPETDEERVGALRLIGEIARHGSEALAVAPSPEPLPCPDCGHPESQHGATGTPPQGCWNEACHMMVGRKHGTKCLRGSPFPAAEGSARDGG